MRWIQELLRREGDYQGEATGRWDQATEEAFLRLIGRENLEERYLGGSLLDEEVLAYLKERYG